MARSKQTHRPTTLALAFDESAFGLMKQCVYGPALIAPAMAAGKDYPASFVATVALIALVAGGALMRYVMPDASRKWRAVGASALAAIPMFGVAHVSNPWLGLALLWLAAFLVGAEALATSVIVACMPPDDAYRSRRMAVGWVWQGLTLAAPAVPIAWAVSRWDWRIFFEAQAVVLVVCAALLAMFCPGEHEVAAEQREPEEIPRSELLLIGIIGCASGYGMNCYDTFLPLAAEDRGVTGVELTQFTFLLGTLIAVLVCMRYRPDVLVMAASVTMFVAFAVSLGGAWFGDDGVRFLIFEGIARLAAEASSSTHSGIFQGMYGAGAAGMAWVAASKPGGQVLAGMFGFVIGASGAALVRYDDVRMSGLAMATVQVAATVVWYRRRRRHVRFGAVLGITMIPEAAGGKLTFAGAAGNELAFSTDTSGGWNAEVTLPDAELFGDAVSVDEQRAIVLIGVYAGLERVRAAPEGVDAGVRNATLLRIGRIASAAIGSKRLRGRPARELDDAYTWAAMLLAKEIAEWRGLDGQEAEAAITRLRAPLVERIVQFDELVAEWVEAAGQAARPSAEPAAEPVSVRDAIDSGNEFWEETAGMRPVRLARWEQVGRVAVALERGRGSSLQADTIATWSALDLPAAREAVETLVAHGHGAPGDGCATFRLTERGCRRDDVLTLLFEPELGIPRIVREILTAFALEGEAGLSRADLVRHVRWFRRARVGARLRQLESAGLLQSIDPQRPFGVAPDTRLRLW